MSEGTVEKQRMRDEALDKLQDAFVYLVVRYYRRKLTEDEFKNAVQWVMWLSELIRTVGER